MIYSGFWRRLLALIIDMLVLSIPNGVIFFALDFHVLEEHILSSSSATELESLSSEQLEQLAAHIAEPLAVVLPSLMLGHLLLFVAWWLYYALMESSSLQGTLGKLAVGSIVTDLEGERISFLKATGRNLGKLISSLLFCVGYLVAGFTERKQALHDMMAGCLVIQKESITKPLYELPE